MPNEPPRFAGLFGFQTLRHKNDAQLIALCLADVAPAWNALIDRYAPLVYTVIRRAGINEADAHDLFQEISLLLYNNLSSLHDTERLAGWLVTTSKRAVWKFCRQREMPTFSESINDEWLLESAIPIGMEAAATPEQTVLNIERQWEIRQSLRELSPLCRELLGMLYGTETGATYAEIARALKMAVNSVGPNRARCLEHLRKNLAANED